MLKFHVLLVLILATCYFDGYSVAVDKESRGCIVSFNIPEENFKTVCDNKGHYHIEQKLKSIDTQLSLFRRKINDINVRTAYTFTRNANYAKAFSGRILVMENFMSNLRSKFEALTDMADIPNFTEEKLFRKRKTEKLEIIESNLNDDQLKRNEFSKIVEDILRREFSVLERKVKRELERRVAESAKPLEMTSLGKMVQNDKLVTNGGSSGNDIAVHKQTNTNKTVESGMKGNISLEYLQDESSFGTELHGDGIKYAFSPTRFDSENDEFKRTLYNSSDAKFKQKFEEIEHDIETLSSGLASLHENMFESVDIRKQFEREKIEMENKILLQLRSELQPLEMETEYIQNQTVLISRLLQAIMKSQEQLQASIQNLNATVKLKHYNIERNISKIFNELDMINSTIDPSYSDAFSVGDAMKVLDIEDTIAFVNSIKGTWPSVIGNLTAVANTQSKISTLLTNDTSVTRACETGNGKHEKSVLEPEDARNRTSCDGYYLLTLTVCTIILSLFMY